MKEKGDSSATMVRDAYRPARGHKAETDEVGAYSAASDDSVLAQWRKRILDVAEEHIRRFGHLKTTVADIASELGVSRANVYRFFPTRAAIDQAVYARIANRTLDVAREVSQKSTPTSVNLAGMFAVLHRDTQLQLMEERHTHELFVAATEGRWKVATWYFGEITKIVEATIREGLQRGELKGDDPGTAARCVIAAITPFVHPNLVQQRVAEEYDLEAELEAQTRFILQALGTVSG